MTSPQWKIEFFSGLQLVGEGRAVQRFRPQKKASLLAYLARFLDRSHPREHLLDTFWPDSPLDAAQTSLRVALTSLRRQLEPPGVLSGAVLMADRSAVWLNPEAVSTDVREFLEAIHAAENEDSPRERMRLLAEAVELCRSEFLPGFYDDWILEQREKLEGFRLQALRDLVRHGQALDAPDRALPYARKLAEAGPRNEEDQRALMRLFAAVGQPDAAVRQYRKLKRTLGERPPSAATRSLLKEIRAGMRQDRNPPASFPLLRSDSSEDASPLISPIADSPALLAEPARWVSLPLQITRFFGREQELEELEAALTVSHERLVTLIGPGGTGKTRLSLEVARRLADHPGFRNGKVAFVPLADLRESRLILPTIRDTLRLSGPSDADPLELIAEAMSDGPSLLLLDNYEQLVEDGAIEALKLLQRIPHLACLVTSRQTLNLPGEREFSLRPLPLPETGVSPEELVRNSSVQLLVDRAQAVRSDFQVVPRNADAVARLCQRLEGIPLALELAASRAGVVPVAQMVEQLERRFDFLVSRKRDGNARHRTLRGAIDWSFDLLPPRLQRLFARLSVFRGGWTLSMAEEVCKTDDDAAPTLEDMELLRECSLIEAEEVEETLDPLQGPRTQWRWDELDLYPVKHQIRYRFLETLREYGEERLSAMGEEESIRYAYYYVLHQLLGVANYVFCQGENQSHLDRDRFWRWFDQEQDNFRAALSWAIHYHFDETALMVTNLVFFYQYRGNWNEAREWLSKAMDYLETLSPRYQLPVLWHAGNFAVIQGDFAEAIEYQKKGVALGREAYRFADSEGERQHLGEHVGAALSALANIAVYQGRYDDAELLYEESLQIRREIDKGWCIAYVLGRQGDLAALRGDDALAERLFHESFQTWEQYNAIGEATTAITDLRLGLLAGRRGDLDEAKSRLEDSLANYQKIGDQTESASVIKSLGDLSMLSGEVSEAADYYQQCLSIWEERVHRREIAGALEGLARLALKESQLAEAVRRFAAAYALREQLGTPLPPRERPDYEHDLANLKDSLGVARFQSLWNDARSAPWQKLLTSLI